MTSRLCVKNLPAYVDEHRLREHFGDKGEVTDAKVIRASDGHSRQFGFVGFKSAEDAQAALDYLNNSYLDTSRLSIQFAYQRGAEALPRAWSKYTPGTTANAQVKAREQSTDAAAEQLQKEKKKKKKKKKKGRQPDAGEDDEQLQEFLQVMQPRRKTAIWSNDAEAALPARGQSGAQQQAQPRKVATAAVAAGSSDEEDELYEDLPAAEPQGGVEQSEDEESEGAAVPKDAAVVDAGVSDLDYLKSRMKQAFQEEDDDAAAAASDEEMSDEEEDEEEAEGRDADGSDEAADTAEATDADAGKDADADAERRRSGEAAGPAPQVVAASEAATIAGTGRLFLRNLAYGATEADLAELLRPFGDVTDVHLVLDKTTKRSKGIALAQFAEPSDAVDAHAALDGTVFQGRLLHVLPGHRPPPKPTDKEGTEAAKGGFKAQREAARRANAGSRAAWNSLFVRADTVAEAVAAHLGITKAELLDPSAPDMAVRQALGETQVIAATKSALGDAGVAVEKLDEAAAASGKAADSKAVERSPSTLLVKNLPYTVTLQELQELFGRHGDIARLVLPPTRVLALVEYLEPSDARSAFRGLAYRRLQHVPLYLEWAPAGIFNGPAASAPLRAPKAAAKAEAAESAGDEATADLVQAADVDVDDAEAEPQMLFVKNLAWKTDDASLRRHFDKAASAVGGTCRSAKVAMRQEKGKKGKALSMGFGFVECSSESVAKAVLKQLQGMELDGHKLLIQLSQRKRLPEDGAKDQSDGKAAKANATKLVARNVAFEATRKDIVGLFGPFGHIKSARLPRKFDGSHRGFAFVDFASKQEAQAALEAVAGTHLYGRRLIVEWASEDAGLDELRAKTAAKFHDDDEDVAATVAGTRAGGKQQREEAEQEAEEQEQQPKKKRKKRKAAAQGGI